MEKKPFVGRVGLGEKCIVLDWLVRIDGEAVGQDAFGVAARIDHFSQTFDGATFCCFCHTNDATTVHSGSQL